MRRDTMRPGRSRHRWAASAGVITTVALALTLAATPAHAEAAIVGDAGPTAVPGSYLVVLQETALARSVSATAERLVDRYGGRVGHVYDAAITGFSVETSERAARRLAADPAVAYVERDTWVAVDATQTNPPSWGLDRIDQLLLPLDSSFTYLNNAANARIYVLDTGIRRTHVEFGGRALLGVDIVNPGGGAADCGNGHGTHVAGTAAGVNHGVAKAARVYAVRVLGCDGLGTGADVIAGVNWVTTNAIRPAVVNMSLSSPANSTVDTAVANSIASGITYVVSAGNNDINACNRSPARVPAAITVAATTATDARWSGSNWGSCVDLFAPGHQIRSAEITSDTATRLANGTSMAAAHVSGAAAMLLSQNPSWTPAQVTTQVVHTATNWVVTNAGTGTPNRLLYVRPTAPRIISL